jgi:hypothetical protein
MKKICVTMLLLLAFSGLAQNNGPTLKETNDWLAKTLKIYASGGPSAYYTAYVFSNFEIDNNCNLTIKETYNLDDPNERIALEDIVHATKVVTIPLGAITNVYRPPIQDPSGGDNYFKDKIIVIETGQIAAVHTVTHYIVPPSSNHVTTEDRSSSKYNIYVASYSVATPGAEMPQPPSQMVPRVVSALQHAVSLCQGTYAAPPQAKEPF